MLTVVQAEASRLVPPEKDLGIRAFFVDKTAAAELAETHHSSCRARRRAGRYGSDTRAARMTTSHCGNPLSEGPMTRRTFALILIASAALCGHARASLYEFTLDGHHHILAARRDPKVGDPFIVAILRRSNDLNPDPRIGRYGRRVRAVQLPLMTYASLGSGNLEVLSVANNFSRLDYVLPCRDTSIRRSPAWLVPMNRPGRFRKELFKRTLCHCRFQCRSTGAALRSVPVGDRTVSWRDYVLQQREIPEPAVAGAILLAVLAHSRR